MKEPKTFKRPRLYWTPLFNGSAYSGRMRIIYPNGDTDWSYHGPIKKHSPPYNPWADIHSCWAIGQKNGFGRLEQMKEYDRQHGHEPAEFLGEL